MPKWNLLILLALLLSLVNCAKTNTNEASTFLLPWVSDQGVYELREVSLDTLSSPYEARGAAAEVYYQPDFSSAGFSSQVARPRLTKSGHVYIPRDTPSSLVLSVYAQYEALYKYEQQLGTVHQLSWPRRVGVDLRLQGDEVSTHNNAHYFTESDTTGILPYSLSQIPFAVNQAIISHEHFHSHFQSQVINPIQALRGAATVSSLENLFYGVIEGPWSQPVENSGSIKADNDVVLRAWNEGLADLFAYLYTGRADIFAGSFPAIQGKRALDAPLIHLRSAEDLKAYIHGGISRSKANIIAYSYQEGTSLARILYKAANSGVESHFAFQQRLLARLNDLPRDLAPNYTQQILDFDRIVPLLLKDFPVSKDLCDQLDSVLSKNVYSQGFPKCL